MAFGMVFHATGGYPNYLQGYDRATWWFDIDFNQKLKDAVKKYGVLKKR